MNGLEFRYVIMKAEDRGVFMTPATTNPELLTPGRVFYLSGLSLLRPKRYFVICAEPRGVQTPSWLAREITTIPNTRLTEWTFTTGPYTFFDSLFVL